MRSLQKGCVAWALALVLLGCGGGGSSGGGGGSNAGGGGNVAPTILPELSGLFSDAGDESRRFYTSTEAGNTGLFAYHPARDERELIDASPYLNDFITSLHPIHRADIAANGQSISQFRIDHLMYFRQENSVLLPDQIVRVSTDPTPLSANRIQVSSESNESKLGSAISNLQVLQYDLSDPLKTAYAFRGNAGANQSWYQILTGTNSSQAAAPFTPGHVVVSTVLDQQNISPGGWLVLDSGNLLQVNMNRTVVGAPMLGDVEEVALLMTLANGEQLLAIRKDDDDHATLWRFSPGATTAQRGAITELKNAQNEALVFPVTMWTGMLALPSQGRMAIDGDTVFLATTTPGLLLTTDVQLYRINNQGWTQLLSLGSTDVLDFTNHAIPGDFLVNEQDHLIWSINGNIERVAKAAPHTRTVIIGGSDNSMDAPEIVAYRDGWLFFNRKLNNDTYRAFAAHTDGRPHITLNTTRWIGASTSGNGPLAGGLRDVEISEVFFWNSSNKELAAVEAATPDLGRVLLGTLPASAADVKMFGIGPGPHRLLQAVHNGTSKYEVIAVDTSQAHSLRHLQQNLTTGETAFLSRPVPGF